MELEESLNFITLPTVAAHQQMAQLIHWSQLMEYMTSLRRPKSGVGGWGVIHKNHHQCIDD